MKNIYICVNDEVTYNRAVKAAYISPWLFHFPNGNIISYEKARNYYHGNSKLLLNLFYNDITGNHEMKVTTAATEKSYPQIKQVNPVHFDNINYEYMAAVFGEK